MNLVFASIFLISVWPQNLLAWNLFGHRLAWLQDTYSEAARIGRQIRDSVREVKPLSLGSAWAPLIRLGDNYIAQMTQRSQRIKELRQEIHKLRQVGKAVESSEAEEELLRLIELDALPEKSQNPEGGQLGLGLSDLVPGELSPVSGLKVSVPRCHRIPGASGASAQPEPLPAGVRNDLPDSGIPLGISKRVFKNKTLVQNAAYAKAEALPTDPEWRFIWRCFYHDKPTQWGLSRVYCIHDRNQMGVFEASIVRFEKDATTQPTLGMEPREDQHAFPIERWKQVVASFQNMPFLPRFWLKLRVEHPTMAHPSQVSVFVEDLIPVLMLVLQHADVNADQKLRNVLNWHLERLLRQAHDDDLEEDQLEIYGQLAQLFNAQGEVDQSVRLALTGASSVQEVVHAQASQAVAPVSVSTQSVLPRNIVRTQSMRADPLRRASNWYKGPRDAKEVPVLEWESRRSKGMNFIEAQAYVASRSSEGWRLPTIWELEALYQQRDVLGEDLLQGLHWSSTAISCEPGGSWNVNLDFGFVSSSDFGHTGCVRFVRCKRDFLTFHFESAEKVRSCDRFLPSP
ncbi:MAG: DUF1566 domain-containing protein [Myxococcaceae bacterium]|nr:DUF1566 domain-containing protein [Myxococcaceae bacterium]MBH2006026.1 DUF1566 domain-containing protein [Myxococcaceae bacterium]